MERPRLKALEEIVTDDLGTSTKKELDRWKIGPGELLESVGYTPGAIPTLNRLLRKEGLIKKGRTSGQYITREEKG